jgi:membrane protein
VILESAGRPDRGVPPPGAGPRSPTQLPRRSLWTAIRRSLVEFNTDNAWDWAAALTYYGVLSIFPGLVVVVSLVVLVRRSALQPLIASLSEVAPGPVRTILDDAVRGLQDSPRQAGLFAVIGFVVALWSASGYAGAFIRAANAAYDVPEGRPIWKTMSIRLAITAATGVLLVLSATIVVVSGNLATAVGRALGLESTTIIVWGIAKWPLLVVLVTIMFAVLYWASPNARQSGFRWVSPGGVVAVVLWLAVSAGFGVYAAHFASYDKTYGTLSGVIVFLTWLWLTNLALLLGLEVDAELERQRAIAAGLPRDAEPYIALRDGKALPSDPSPGLGDTGRVPRRPSGPGGAERPPDTGAPPAARPAGSLSATVGFGVGVAIGALIMAARRPPRRRRRPAR